MRIKSYFADSVQEAIEKARVELGPDAMLMNSKRTDFELRALGSVEVVFGLPGQTAASKPRLQIGSPAPAQETLPALSPANDRLAVSGEVAQELAELRRQIETVRRSMNRQQRSATGSDEKHSSAAESLSARLIASGLSEDLAQEIAEAVELQAFAWKHGNGRGLRDFEMVPSETIELALTAELEKRIQVSSELGVSGRGQKVVMFAGPAGAGKTTSLIKLGLRYGLQARLPMHILSLDTLRVGGWEQLSAYARIAGLSFDAVHNLSTLDTLLAQHSDKKLILIDTPGFGPNDMDDLNDLADWARRVGGVDVHVVMPATYRTAVIGRTLERFSVLKPAKLLLTRADEAESQINLVDIAMKSALPLSFISNGQTIPEDLVPAVKEDLLAPLTGRRLSKVRQEAA